MASARLLLQDGTFLLLQNGDKLLLQDDSGTTTPTPDIRHYPRGEVRGVVRGAA